MKNVYWLFFGWIFLPNTFKEISREKLEVQFNLSILNLLDKTNTLQTSDILWEVETEVTVKRIEELSLGFTPNFPVQLFFLASKKKGPFEISGP
jgi:hypothetical protein